MRTLKRSDTVNITTMVGGPLLNKPGVSVRIAVEGISAEDIFIDWHGLTKSLKLSQQTEEGLVPIGSIQMVPDTRGESAILEEASICSIVRNYPDVGPRLLVVFSK